MATFDSLQDRWQAYRPSKTQAFWFAAGCVAATLALGFGPGGWVTGGTAEKQVTGAAESARYELATAVCVEGFMRANASAERLEKLQAMSFYLRSDEVAQAGYATMPDQADPDSTVAIMCASRLSEMEPPVH
jgi:hypothetical protein